MVCCIIYSLLYLILLNLVLRNNSLYVNSISYRLPNNSYPIKYDLRIKVNLEKNQTLYSVRERVHIKIKEASQKITMHSKGTKEIKSITVLDISSNKEHKATHSYANETDFLIVDLPFKMLPGNEIILKISFGSNMKRASSDFNNNRGIVLTSYIEPDGSIEYVIFTGFDPNLAREFFPCFDEPSIKATFELEIDHNEYYNAVSNMPAVSQKKIKGNKSFVRTKFQETPKMSTNLLAFFVSKFQPINVTNSRVPQRIYAKKSMVNNEFIKFMTESLGKILKIFEDLFQIPYSLPKLDHVFAPDYFHAIENWGVIGYTEVAFKGELIPYWNTKTIFHELAHHYFGNLVTPKWWSNMWLKEGFACFYETETQLQFYPMFKDKFQTISLIMQVHIMQEDIQNSTKSLSSRAESPIEVLGKLDDLTYHKGAAIIKMFKFAIGTETWNKGIRNYLKQHQYGSTEPKDLHEALQKAYNEDNPKNRLNIENLMSKWENQNGYPNITVSLVNGTLKLAQMNSFNKKLIYPVPITYSSPSNLNFDNLSTKFWFTTRTIEIRSFVDKWIVFNNQQIGYYKVDYDENLWNAIIDQFNKNHSVIHWMNRITLINTLYDNVEANKSDVKMLYRLMKYVKNENNLEVVELSVISIFKFLFKDYRNDEKLKSELRNLFNVFYERVRYDNSWFNLIHDMSSYLNVKNCSTDVINKMKLDFNNSDRNTNSTTSYCNALRHANETIVDLFYNHQKASIYYDQNYTFIQNLGCITNTKLFEKTLRIYFEDNNHIKYPVEPPYIKPTKLVGWMIADSTQLGLLNFLENNLPKLALESPVLLGEFLYCGRKIMENNYQKKRLKRLKANALKINHKVNDDSFETEN